MWNGWQTPDFLTNALSLIGQVSIPMMLLTLGVAIARFHPRGLGRALLLSGFKLTTCAGIGWATAHIFALPPVAGAVLTLQIATPVAVSSYLLAEKYGAGSDDVAGLVVVSTLLSVLGLPIILGFVI